MCDIPCIYPANIHSMDMYRHLLGPFVLLLAFSAPVMGLVTETIGPGMKMKKTHPLIFREYELSMNISQQKYKRKRREEDYDSIKPFWELLIRNRKTTKTS